MSPDDYRRSLEYIEASIWNDSGKRPTHVTVEYVGGEILLVPPQAMKEIVEIGRKFFSDRNIIMRDGAQTNLIASKRRLDNINELFEGRIGTSIDNVSEQRTVSGSNDRYNELHGKGELVIATDKKAVPAVFTLDKITSRKSIDQYRISEKEGRDLTVRQVFGGGKDVELLAPEVLASSLVNILEEWVMTGKINVEPLASLIKKRLQGRFSIQSGYNLDLCPFQNNCHERSLSLDPNGDLYICQEMADSSNLKLGNALTEYFDADAFSLMKNRPLKLDRSCYQCSYFQECQGGCAMESMQFGNGPHGKTAYCDTWKILFAAIDDKIDMHGAHNISKWVNGL
jgi:radical SAM protein with 4Fe4S-binding SPASM domain